MTSYGNTVTYTYDGQNNMLSCGGVTYTYDANGERLTKNVGSDIYSYYYNGVNLLFTKKNGEIFGAVDENDVAYWYCYDIRGSITKVMKGDTNTSISTTLDTSYVYNAYGDTTTTTAEGCTFRNDIAYTGAIIDQETGLYYLMSRYYDPSIGQFISEDSYRGEGEAFWHLYAYCDGDPVNNTDRDGKRSRQLSETSSSVLGVRAYIKVWYKYGTSYKGETVKLIKVFIRMLENIPSYNQPSYVNKNKSLKIKRQELTIAQNGVYANNSKRKLEIVYNQYKVLNMKYRRAYTFIVPNSWKPILLTANAHSVGADYSIALSTGTKKIYYVTATAPVEISSPVGINEFLPDRREK